MPHTKSAKKTHAAKTRNGVSAIATAKKAIRTQIKKVMDVAKSGTAEQLQKEYNLAAKKTRQGRRQTRCPSATWRRGRSRSLPRCSRTRSKRQRRLKQIASNMSFDLASVVQPPLLTADLPGIGGRIKAAPKISTSRKSPPTSRPATATFSILWIEKRAMGAEYFIRQVAHRLGDRRRRSRHRRAQGSPCRHAAVGVGAGQRRSCNLPHLDGDGIRVLQRQPARQQAPGRPSSRQSLSHRDSRSWPTM